MIAQVEHGPAMHGGALAVVLMVLVAIAVAGGLVYLVQGRRSFDRDSASKRGPEPSDRNPEG
jgi:hypothetical protein